MPPRRRAAGKSGGVEPHKCPRLPAVRRRWVRKALERYLLRLPHPDARVRLGAPGQPRRQPQVRGFAGLTDVRTYVPCCGPDTLPTPFSLDSDPLVCAFQGAFPPAIGGVDRPPLPQSLPCDSCSTVSLTVGSPHEHLCCCEPTPCRLTLLTASRFGRQRAIVRVQRRDGGCCDARNIRSEVLRVGGMVVGCGGLKRWCVGGSTAL